MAGDPTGRMMYFFSVNFGLLFLSLTLFPSPSLSLMPFISPRSRVIVVFRWSFLCERAWMCALNLRDDHKKIRNALVTSMIDVGNDEENCAILINESEWNVWLLVDDVAKMVESAPSVSRWHWTVILDRNAIEEFLLAKCSHVHQWTVQHCKWFIKNRATFSKLKCAESLVNRWVMVDERRLFSRQKGEKSEKSEKAQKKQFSADFYAKNRTWKIWVSPFHGCMCRRCWIKICISSLPQSQSSVMATSAREIDRNAYANRVNGTRSASPQWATAKAEC